MKRFAIPCVFNIKITYYCSSEINGHSGVGGQTRLPVQKALPDLDLLLRFLNIAVLIERHSPIGAGFNDTYLPQTAIG